MCGIFGFIGNESAAPVVIKGLLKLEYLGYDSAGIVCIANGILHLKKDKGKIGEIDRNHNLSALPGNVAIAHTRWATHGGVNKENAHPHSDCLMQVSVVHNGSIENFRELRDELQNRGHFFKSDTDTEVIPHLLEENIENGHSLEQAVLAAVKKLKGSYAFIAISAREPDKIVATRMDSPLIIGTGIRGSFITSDVISLEGCDKVIYLEDGEAAVLKNNGVTFLVGDGSLVEKQGAPLNAKEQEYNIGGYEHFMHKEIYEKA